MSFQPSTFQVRKCQFQGILVWATASNRVKPLSFFCDQLSNWSNLGCKYANIWLYTCFYTTKHTHTYLLVIWVALLNHIFGKQSLDKYELRTLYYRIPILKTLHHLECGKIHARPTRKRGESVHLPPAPMGSSYIKEGIEGWVIFWRRGGNPLMHVALWFHFHSVAAGGRSNYVSPRKLQSGGRAKSNQSQFDAFFPLTLTS